MLASLVAAGLIGGRVGAWLFGPLAAADFLNPNVPGATSTMAAAFVGLVAIGAHRKLGMHVIDDVAPSLWVMLAFGRLGCVFQGCDFGRPSVNGVAFSSPSPAWHLHAQQGWVALQSNYSAATAPFALFAVGAAVLALVVSLRSRDGALRSAGAYLVVGLFVEFLREPLTTEYWGPLSRPQWFMTAMLLVLFWVVRRRDHQGVHDDTVS